MNHQHYFETHFRYNSNRAAKLRKSREKILELKLSFWQGAFKRENIRQAFLPKN